jgi:hypothetical protein
MNKDDFRHYADAYGARIDHWPAAVKAEAQAVAATEWAQEILDAAAATDDLFGALDQPVAPSRVGSGIAAVNARIGNQGLAWRGLLRRFAWQWAGMATAGVLGIWVAVATTGPSMSSGEAASELFALTLSFSDSAFISGFGGIS